MKLYFFTIICFLASNHSLFGNSSTLKTIESIKKTKFISTYIELRTEVINTKKATDNYIGQLDSSSISNLKQHYNASAKLLNTMIEEFAADIANPKTRKIIINHPDIYIRNVESKFREATDYYNRYFIQKLYDYTDGEYDSTPFALIIKEVIYLIRECISLIRELKQDTKNLEEQLIQEYFVKPLSIPYWK